MSVKDVHAALSARLNTLGLTVAWENVPFSPGDATWVREKFAPDMVVAAGLGPDGANRVVGVYFVDVFAPSGGGWKGADDAAETVMGGFPRGAALTSGSTAVRIVRSYRTAGRNEANWYQVPVAVEFRADIAP